MARDGRRPLVRLRHRDRQPHGVSLHAHVQLAVHPTSRPTTAACCLRRASSYRFDDQTNAYVTRSEGYRIGGGNNFRVCTDAEIALLTDTDAGNDPPQSGCIYEDQALIRPDTTTNYEAGLRRSWRDGRFSASGTLFHVDWEDIQVAGLTPFSAEPITLNGSGAVSRGGRACGVPPA